MTFENIVARISSIPDSSFEKLDEIITQEHHAKGHMLFKEGKVNNNIYFISKGIARAYVSQDDLEVTFWFAQESDPLFSIQSYVDNQPGYENIELLEDSVLYQLKKEELEILYNEDIYLANWGRKLADKSFVETEKRLIARQFKSSEERYNDLIKSHPELLQRVQLKLIASYLGMTQVTLSRVRARR